MSQPVRLGALAWASCAAYVALIWRLSSEVQTFEGLAHVPFQDKGVHFLEYGALTCLCACALALTSTASRPRRAAAAIWLTACAGLLDELHQAFVYGRSGELPDLLADVLGALAVSALLGALSALRVRVPA